MSSQGPNEGAEGDSLPREAEGGEMMGGRRDHKPRKDGTGFYLEPVEDPALPTASTRDTGVTCWGRIPSVISAANLF